MFSRIPVTDRTPKNMTTKLLPMLSPCLIIKRICSYNLVLFLVVIGYFYLRQVFLRHVHPIPCQCPNREVHYHYPLRLQNIHPTRYLFRCIYRLSVRSGLSVYYVFPFGKNGWHVWDSASLGYHLRFRSVNNACTTA